MWLPTATSSVLALQGRPAACALLLSLPLSCWHPEELPTPLMFNSGAPLHVIECMHTAESPRQVWLQSRLAVFQVLSLDWVEPAACCSAGALQRGLQSTNHSKVN